MGQELVQLADFMVMDPVEHISEPVLGIDALVFAGSEEGVEHSGALSGFMTAAEQIVFTADGRRANDILHQIIVDLYMAIDKEQIHVLPVVEGI